MKQIISSRKQYLLLLLVFLVYAIVSCATQYMQADDFFWYHIYDYELLASWRMPNGRYVSNTLTYLIIRYPLLRWLIYPLLELAMLWLLGALPTRESNNDTRAYWLALGLLILIPIYTYASVFYYLSAFVIYVLPMVCAMAYLRICFRDPERSKQGNTVLLCIGVLMLGLIGALCLESMTLYACCLGVFFVLWSFFAMKKRDLAVHLSYLVGTLAGTLIMFTNANYSTIADSDQVGARFYEFNFSDILARLYREIIPRFARPSALCHVLIAATLYYLYTKAEKADWSKERRCYALLTSIMTVVYAVYSLFSKMVTPLEETSWAMRVCAVETALAFLYCVSILYLVYVLFPRDRFFRAAIYLCSAAINTFVFCFVSPISARCFFANYLFWILLTLELVLYADRQHRLLGGHLVKVLAVTFCSMMLYCNIVNKYASVLQISHLRAQLEDPQTRSYEIVVFPYPAFDGGTHFASPCLGDETITEVEQIGLLSQDEAYFRLWAEYYDYDIDPSAFRTIEFDLLDFNTESLSTEQPNVNAQESQP